jgi:hypothetical protein
MTKVYYSASSLAEYDWTLNGKDHLNETPNDLPVLPAPLRVGNKRWRKIKWSQAQFLDVHLRLSAPG